MKKVPRSIPLKQLLLNSLAYEMYDATEKRFNKRLRAIITQNTLACKLAYDYFLYKGETYSLEMVLPRYKNQKLMQELHPVMDTYLAEKKKIGMEEQPYVIGFFTKMLNTSNSIDDYLAILPDCMHRAIHRYTQEYPSLPRQMTDEQVDQFKQDHSDWIFLLKKRMVLDLVLL